VSVAAVRPATDADSAAIIEIIRVCWTAYPGVIVDVDGEMPELRHFAGYCESLGGTAWVAELEGRVVGCIGMVPDEDPGAWLLIKLNVLPEARRRGIAGALVREAEAAARAQDAVRMALWSDTRFVESHLFYASLGYERMPMTRELGDLGNTVEYRFRKSL
jgi:GNAT superfamily N-acetyltransferase